MSSNSQVIDQEPEALGQKEVRNLRGGGPRELARVIDPTRAGGRRLDFVTNHEGRPRMPTLFSVASVRAAFCRLKAGEELALLETAPMNFEPMTCNTQIWREYLLPVQKMQEQQNPEGESPANKTPENEMEGGSTTAGAVDASMVIGLLQLYKVLVETAALVKK